MNNQEQERLQAKTPEQCFLRVLEQDFHYAPKPVFDRPIITSRKLPSVMLGVFSPGRVVGSVP
jgi:hypothetical protein